MQASANKLLRVGNPAELNRVQGDSGAFLSKTRIGVESRNKSNLMKSLQNAVSYVQMQEAGIKSSNKHISGCLNWLCWLPIRFLRIVPVLN